MRTDALARQVPNSATARLIMASATRAEQWLGAENAVDEEPRCHAFRELRRRNIRAAMWKLRRHYGAGTSARSIRRLVPATFRVSDAEIADLLNELRASEFLRNSLSSDVARRFYGTETTSEYAKHVEERLLFAGSDEVRGLFLYVIPRLLRPKMVVETGCFTGWDSAVLLQALHDNGEGHLYTIDLPAEEGRFSQVGRNSSLPADLSPGFLVPDAFRSRWSLIIGDARQELPRLLGEFENLDFFYHDSHHSYSHMIWEYSTVWPHLIEKGILVSDDIAWNTSLLDFSAGVGRPIVIHERNANVGAICKASY